MIYSMTGYASATRELAAATGNGGVSVSVELRTVNSRFLDLNFRMPEDVRVCEPTLREMLMNKLSRGVGSQTRTSSGMRKFRSRKREFTVRSSTDTLTPPVPEAATSSRVALA